MRFVTALLDKYHYRDPLKFAKHVVNKRTDQGVDYWASVVNPIRAMGDCKVTRVSHTSGWPNGVVIQYVLTGAGSHKGEVIYVAEYISPVVKVGQWVPKGATIAHFSSDWRDAVGIETGFIRRGTDEPCSTDTSRVACAWPAGCTSWAARPSRTQAPARPTAPASALRWQGPHAARLRRGGLEALGRHRPGQGHGHRDRGEPPLPRRLA